LVKELGEKRGGKAEEEKGVVILLIPQSDLKEVEKEKGKRHKRRTRGTNFYKIEC